MEPNAYVLREDHPVFRSPQPVDFSQSVDIDVPDAWSGKIDDPTVRVLPMVADKDQDYRDGWCTYTYEHLQAPELEIICGGVNAKTPLASAIWRQGNLLHFGFEQSPSEMNENGNAMLVNSIQYIARFQNDRAIIRRSKQGRVLDRAAIDRLLNNPNRKLKTYLEWFFASGDLLDELSAMSRDELRTWYTENRGYLTADRRGKFFIDKQALAFGVHPDSKQFIPTAIKALEQDEDEMKLAKSLLVRYVPSLAGNTSPGEWQTWWQENQRFLFFSDSGGFRWYVDPLAKRRNVESSSIAGEARADTAKR